MKDNNIEFINLALEICNRATEYTSEFARAATFIEYISIWFNNTYLFCPVKISNRTILKSREVEDIFLIGYAQKHCDSLKPVFDNMNKEKRNNIIEAIQDIFKTEIQSLDVLSEEKRTIKSMTDFIAESKTLKFKGRENHPTSDEIFHYSPTGELSMIWDWFAFAKLKERKDKRDMGKIL